MSCESVVVVRRAVAPDRPAREALVRQGLASHYRDAFLLFFFQELTLECCVLCGAVLFIFAGVSAVGCCAVLPAAAIVVALTVVISHQALTEKQIQNMRKEVVGFVAELRGPLLLEPRGAALPVLYEHEPLHAIIHKSVHTQIVGTVSVSEYCGPKRSGWLHALHVHAPWRRRGCGRALVNSAQQHAVGAGLESLEAVASELQHAVRALLHQHGWQCRGSYHRRLCGAALTLFVSQLGADLPPLA